MFKKPLLLVVPLLLLGLESRVSAQTYNYDVSFSGSGTLPVSQTTYYDGSTPDPTVNLTLNGTGQDVDSFLGYFIGFPFYGVSSTLTTSGSITIPNTLDPLASPTTLSPLVFSTGYPAILFGPSVPESGGLAYSGSPGPTGSLVAFQYNPTTVLGVQFDGETNTLTLGPSYTQSQSGDIVTYTYADSTVDLSATIGELDPMVDFTGNFSISMTVPSTVPDTLGWSSIFVLAGVCIAGGLQKKARVA